MTGSVNNDLVDLYGPDSYIQSPESIKREKYRLEAEKELPALLVLEKEASKKLQDAREVLAVQIKFQDFFDKMGPDEKKMYYENFFDILGPDEKKVYIDGLNGTKILIDKLENDWWNIKKEIIMHTNWELRK